MIRFQKKSFSRSRTAVCSCIMGILNVTPDSFSDGGKFLSAAAAVRRAEKMVAEGADIIDIGGESTGPGSTPVSLEEELRRVMPVIKKIAKFPKVKKGQVLISIDTTKAEVARQALAAGARIVNDISGLRTDRNMARVIAEAGATVVIMFSAVRSGRATRAVRRYRDVVKTIKAFFLKQIACARRAGIPRNNIILDPGMGFFVSADPSYSFEIIRRLDEIVAMGYPVLVGPSRKSFLGGPLSERDEKTLAVSLLVLLRGARIIRTHNVAALKPIVCALPKFSHSTLPIN